MLAAGALRAQPRTGELPLNPDVVVGTLPNGMTYYIQRNAEPKGRAELRLAVYAGSVLENPDQRGLAHFCEHMAFNGTADFHKQAIINFIEHSGMRFGADLNAYTSFDQTVYILQLPSDRAATLDTGLMILENWADKVSYEDEEIDKERGVVGEEWRLGRGADSRMRDQLYPTIYHNSLYAERLPIGMKPVLDTAHYQTLRDFYRTWYRPDLMAVVAVGDFDPEAMKQSIMRHFGSIPARTGLPKRPQIEIPDHKQTLVAVASDAEATRSAVSVYYKHPYLSVNSESGYRQTIVAYLGDGMLGERLDEVRQSADAPFLFAYSTTGNFNTAKRMHQVGAGVPNGGIVRGLEALMTEVERVRRHGFTAGELERQKLSLLRSTEQQYNEREKTESGNLANEYVGHFLFRSPTPGIEWEYRKLQEILPTITLEEVNRAARALITDKNRVVTASSPKKEGVDVPTQAELLAVFDRVAKKEVSPYVDKVTAGALMGGSPTPGSIKSERTMGSIGVTEWTLSNGVRVVLKPTDFKNDEVLMSATSPGGTSLVSDDDYRSATYAAAIVNESGLGEYDRVTLNKMLTGKVAGVSPSISELQEGVSGGGSTKDLETLFQLTYLTFTAPRSDPNAYTVYMKQMEANLQNRAARPENAFADTLQGVLYNYHPRRMPTTLADLPNISQNRALTIYRDRFADASDFTFIFVGSFTLEQMRPLVERYLASLPATNRGEKWRDLGVTFPTAPVEKRVRKGVEPKGQVQMIWTGSFPYSREERFLAGAMTEVLQNRIRESLREEKGGAYSPYIGIRPQKYPKEEYTMTLGFGCDPKRADELIAEALRVIDEYKKNGPTSDEVQKVQSTYLRDREVQLRDNRFWMNMLSSRYWLGEDPETIPDIDKLANKLTAKDIQGAAQRYFNNDRLLRVILQPEK